MSERTTRPGTTAEARSEDHGNADAAGDLATPESAGTGNRRVDRLLAAARRHGWTVEHRVLTYTRSPDAECWTLRPEPNPDGYSITVYAERNHAASVLADIPGHGDWSRITQRQAHLVMASNPTCPASAEPECWATTGWLSGQTYCGLHGRSAGWPCSAGNPPGERASDDA